LGEAFLSKCAPQFKHRQDKAYEAELKMGNLFSDRDESSTHEYTCMLADDAAIEVGDRIILAPGEGGVVVPTIMNIPIGQFDASDLKALDADLSSKPVSRGIALAEVMSISPLGGAVLRLCE
jgi:hypothetical protein